MSRDPDRKSLIAFLYGDRGNEVELALDQILERFKAVRPAPEPRDPFFSERDAVLICYADHVRERDEPALQTLHRFLLGHVRDLLPAVHILPFYPYSSDDGFSVVDYCRVKDEFGDWSDVDRIAEDFDLMVDLVINHVSAQSDWFRAFLAGESQYAEHFITFEEPVDVSSVFRPRTHPLLTHFDTAAGERHVWTTFSEDQIDVNFASPDVLLEYIRILLFYIEHGARVIRLDAIAFLWKELGTRSLHLPQTHAVVKLLRRILAEVAPDVWVITETNVPHQENISYFGSGDDEAHLVYNFALPPLLLYSFFRGDATLLTCWAASLGTPSPETAFFNFTASHDGIGVTALREMIPADELRELLDAVEERGGRISYRSVPGEHPVPYELNIVYLDAVGGADQLIASQAIALSLQGVPGIYLNSLVGAENWKEGVDELGYNRAINRQKFDLGRLEAELHNPTSTMGRVYAAYATLLRARRAEPLFSPLAAQSIADVDPRVFAVLRSDGSRRLLCLANVCGDTVRLQGEPLCSLAAGDTGRDLVTDSTISFRQGLVLDPYGVAWLTFSGGSSP